MAKKKKKNSARDAEGAVLEVEADGAAAHAVLLVAVHRHDLHEVREEAQHLRWALCLCLLMATG